MLPAKVHLPSGRTAGLSEAAATGARSVPATPPATRASAPAPPRAARRSREPGPPRAPLGDDLAGPFAEALTLLAAPGVLTDDRGAPLDVDTLALRDLHVLRALLTRAALVREDPGEFTCENCGAAFEAAPSTLLELGPFLDGELSDPDLDAPFPFGEPLPIPRIALPTSRPRAGARRAARRSTAARGASASADTVTFAERTTHDARALFRIADALLSGRARSLRITPAIVLGMGVVALGSERRTPVLAEALAGASNAAWSAIVARWHDAAYTPRLFAVHRCDACGARNDLDVPLAREFEREPPSREGVSRPHPRAPRPPFPDLDAFESLVRAHAARIYAARAVRNIDLFVDADVAACDDGGEPLLGSYTPGGSDEDLGVAHAPEVRLYYRTFRSEYRADPSFDVEAEIHETIDHEIEHHLNHLSGVDPLDEEEHAAIDGEEIRRIGARESARRGRKALAADLQGFFRATWLLWLAVALAALITWASR